MQIVRVALAVVLGLWFLPSAALAESAPKRVGVLAAAHFPAIDNLRQGMRDRGWIEGQNITFEYRWAERADSRYPALAAELVALHVDVIVTWGTPAALAAKQATARIPIVLGAIADPVEAGIVTNFFHPGGNVTGFSTQNVELDGKRLDLLKELIPNIVRVSFLTNSNNPAVTLGVIQANSVAKERGLTVDTIAIQTLEDLDQALALIKDGHPDAVLMVADTLLLTQRQRIVDFMAASRLPAIYAYPEFVESGGLISYSTDYAALLHQAADYVDRVLKGETPGNLPIQRASRFKLVVNLNTAKSLGITVPQAVLARADKVVE
jgi:putative ABC transport system substrate-binding protein